MAEASFSHSCWVVLECIRGAVMNQALVSKSLPIAKETGKVTVKLSDYAEQCDFDDSFYRELFLIGNKSKRAVLVEQCGMEFLNTNQAHKYKKVGFTVCSPGKKTMLPASFFAVSPGAVAVTVAVAVAEADRQTEPEPETERETETEGATETEAETEAQAGSAAEVEEILRLGRQTLLDWSMGLRIALYRTSQNTRQIVCREPIHNILSLLRIDL
jgi:hypothetical protein